MMWNGVVNPSKAEEVYSIWPRCLVWCRVEDGLPEFILCQFRPGETLILFSIFREIAQGAGWGVWEHSLSEHPTLGVEISSLLTIKHKGGGRDGSLSVVV